MPIPDIVFATHEGLGYSLVLGLGRCSKEKTFLGRPDYLVARLRTGWQSWILKFLQTTLLTIAGFSFRWAGRLNARQQNPCRSLLGILRTPRGRRHQAPIPGIYDWRLHRFGVE